MKFDINRIIQNAEELGIEVSEVEENKGKLRYRNSKGNLVEFDAIELLIGKSSEVVKTKTPTMPAKKVIDRIRKEAKRVNEKDGKIILDKNDSNDMDWWDENE